MNRHGSMNHIYRLAWSSTSNSWVPVAETTRGPGQGRRRTLLAAALSLTAMVAEAAPRGGQVVAGTGSITQSSSTTTIRQSSQNLSLDWLSFNVAPRETVDFVQPSATSIAVNRIFDINGSQILGHVNANGQVYLLNPNGVVFGRGAEVNVGGLVASTLDLHADDIGRTKTFSGAGAGGVVNAGVITAANGGYVVLLGNHVSNQGVITAQLGSVALGAGSAATLTFSGSSLVHMQVDKSVLNSVAENSGLILANGGHVVMTAGAKDALLASVVNNTGVIDANTVEDKNGSIVLTGGMKAGQVNVGGTLDVSSTTGQGGEVVVTADNVIVEDGAHVSATGRDGGSINIGGGWQDGGGIDQATRVYVAPTASLDSSATGSGHGNGGEISVRSDIDNARSTTQVYGSLSARGGAAGGDGGRIETSGHWLDVTGIVVDAAAAAGHAGEWLLDPYNVIIGSVASGNTYTPPNFSPTSSDSTILASTISTALSGGSNVTITTGSAGASLGDITVSSAIAKTSGSAVSLTLQAADSIIVNQPISNTSGGALAVNLWADNDNGAHDGVGVVILNAGISTAGGAIAFGTGATQSINGVTTLVGGDVYVGGTSAVNLNTGGGGVGFHGQLIIANSNGLNINTANGNVNFDGLVDSGNSYALVNASNVTWTTALSAAKSGIGANVGDTYLATLTSRLENAVAGAAANYVASWLGGERITGIGSDAVWRWVAGPEGLQNNGQGLQFFTQNGSGTANGSGGTAIGGAYTNWNSGEPNNFNGTSLSPGGSREWALQFVGTRGQWNDLNPTSNSLPYVKETNLTQSPLNITAGTGVVTFSKALGSNKPLVSLDVTAQTIALNSNTVDTSGAQTFTGQVTVGGVNVDLLTVSANSLTTTYGSGVPALTASYSGFVNGDTVSSLTSPATVTTTASAQPNAGSYPITASGVVDPSYYILYNPGSLIVNLAPLTIAANNASKTYGQVNPGLSATYSGFVYGDTQASMTTLATMSTAATSASNAGTYAITPAGAVPSSNYSIVYSNGTLTVNPAVVTLSGLAGTSRAYDGTTVDALTGTGSLSGLVGGQTLTLANAGSGTLASANAGSEALTTAVTLANGTGLASNYVLTQPTLANVNIAQAPLTVTGLAGTNRTYDGTTLDALTGTGSLSGLVAGETLTLANASNGTLASANAGSEALATAITLANGTGLARVPLTVNGLAGTNRTYDGTTLGALSGTGSLSGLVAGETLTLANASNGTLASAHAGSEALTTALTLANGTGLASNYMLTQPTLANVTITQAALTVTGLAGTNRAYDGTTLDALTGAGSLSGLVAGETLTLANASGGTLALANAGSEALSTAITLANGTGLASNYSLTQPTLANVTIAQAPLTVTGTLANDKVYDGTTIATLRNGGLSGVFGADAVSLTQAGSFVTKNAGSNVAVTAADTLGGMGAANYVLIQPSGVAANITPLAISVSATGTNKTYDGALSDAAILTSAGVIAGDAVTFADISAVFPDKNVGVAKPVMVTGISAAGADAGNYIVSSTSATTTASITQLGSVTWVGPVLGGDWSNPANWAGGAIPDLANVANVVVPAGANVTFDANVAGPVTISRLSGGGLTMDGGILQVANALNLMDYTQSGGTLSGTGSFASTIAFSQSGGQIAIGGAVSIVQTQGNLSFADISGSRVNLSSTRGNVTLGSLTTAGNLAVLAQGGAITQASGSTLTVDGSTTLAASSNGMPADISVNNAGNRLLLAVSAAGAQVTLRDAVPMTLGTVTASGDLTAHSNGALNLGASTVGGRLAVDSANGDVTQSGPLQVQLGANIVAGTGSIDLNNAANVFKAGVTALGSSVQLGGEQPGVPQYILAGQSITHVDASALSPDSGAQATALNLSPTITVTRDAESGGASKDESRLSPPGSTEAGMANVTMNIGALGPSLSIVNGGVRLPNRIN